MGTELSRTDTRIPNYRIEHVDNGYVLHCTRGNEGPVTKWVFIDKKALLAHLDKVL